MSLDERVYQLELLCTSLKQTTQDTRDLYLNMKCTQESFQDGVNKVIKELVDMVSATNLRISRLEQSLEAHVENFQAYVKSQEASQARFRDEFAKFQTEIRASLQELRESQVAQSQAQQSLKDQIKAELSIEIQMGYSQLSSQYFNYEYPQSQFHQLLVAYQPFDWSLDLVTNQARSVSPLDSQLSILSNYRWFLSHPLSSELPSQSDQASSDESNHSSSNYQA